MNSNDFVVLPNNKAKSVKLKARNMQELQLKTVTLGQERQEMEEKLQQLKESMSKEKEERGYSGWKSGQCDSLISNALTNSTKKSKEIMLQKLSAGKVKIRVLKDEPLTVFTILPGSAPPQPPPPPPAISSRAARKNRLRGRYCGQCEVKTAGLMCAECTEDYCIGCFTKFHQKGALKLHRIIPIQTDLQTHVSTRDVVSCFQKQIDPCSHPSNFTNLNPSSSFSSSPKPKPSPSHSIKSNATTRQGHGRTEEGTEAVAKPMQLSPDHMQVLAVNQAKEKKVEMTEEGLNRADERAVPTDLFSGEYNEEDSARSFQEALRQWRGEKSDGAEEPMSEEAMWIPVRPVSAMATQADLTSDRRAEGRGRGGGEGRVPVRVEFTENSLTYLDRLLLKKHRRTPIETYHPPLVFCADLNSLPNINTEDDTGSSLTAQEEDFHRYCASLFAVAVSSGRTEPEITTPESCLTIEVLDERDRDVDGDVVVEQKTDNIKVPSIQELHCQVRTPVPQTALTSGGSSRVSRSSPRPIQTSRQSRSPALHNAAQKLHLSKTTGAEHSIKSSSSKSKPSARPTAETPRTSKTLIKTPTSTSQKPNCSPTVHKSKPDHGSTRFLSSPSLPHIQTEIPKSSHAPLSFPPDVSSLAGARPPIPEEHLSLRSTFTLSPSGSTESIFLPKVDQSNPFHEGSDSSLLPEQARSSQLFPEPVSSLKLSQSPPSNLESSRKSPNRPCDPESLLSDYQLQPSLSPVPSSPNLPRKYPRPLKSLFRVSLLNDSLPDAYSRQMSTPTNENAPDQESTLSLQYAKSNPSLPLNVLHSPHSAVKMDEEEEELSIDSGDEMSSDSLGVASHEEDSSDEGHSTRGRPGDEEREISDIHAEGKKDFQSDEKEQLSEPLMVMHKQIAGSGSEHFSDLDVSLPLGLDVNCGHSDTPKHTHWDSHQTSPYDSEPKGSQGYWPTSSLSSYTEEHLVFEMVKDNTNQSTGIQIHSATPTGRGEISANEPGTSGSGSNRSTPTASQAPATCCLSHPISCSELGTVPRPLSRAAQEIMEICSVDQTGCEDPDLETDRTAHTLYKLEEELRLLSKEIGKQAPVFGAGNSGSQYQHENHPSTRGRDSEDQKEEDEAVQTDQRSVLLLP